MKNYDLFGNIANPFNKRIFPATLNSKGIFSAKLIDVGCTFMSFVTLHFRYQEKGGGVITGDKLTELFVNSGRTADQLYNHVKIWIREGLVEASDNWYRNTRKLKPTKKGLAVFYGAFSVVLPSQNDHEQDLNRIFAEMNLKYFKKVSSKTEMARILGWSFRRIKYNAADFTHDDNADIWESEATGQRPSDDRTTSKSPPDNVQVHIKTYTDVNILSVVNDCHGDESPAPGWDIFKDNTQLSIRNL